MGNARSNYERHEDAEQQRRMAIGKEFRLVLGQLHLASDAERRKKISFGGRQQRHREVSSSSSNSTGTSSSASEHHPSTVSLVQLDIPTAPFDSNELDAHALTQYLLQQESYGRELAHVFHIPFAAASNSKTRSKTLPTLTIASVYYDQPCSTHDLNVDVISLDYENELERTMQVFNDKNILSICNSKPSAYVIHTKGSPMPNRYKLVRSTTMAKTALDNFDWLHPFIDYSNLGYRLCGLVPYVHSPAEGSFTIYWVFESAEANDVVRYDYAIVEYQLKSAACPNWLSLLSLMSKQEWKLVATFDYSLKKKSSEQLCFLLFFQRLKR